MLSEENSEVKETCYYPDDFFTAVHEGNCKKVRGILKSKQINVNIRDAGDPLKRNALLYASEVDDTDMVKTLFKCKPKPDINAETVKGRRAIWWAAKHGNVKIADQLLKYTDCDVNTIDRETGCSPLYRALITNCSEVVKSLIHAGADVNLRRLGYSVGAETPLMKCVQLDNRDICEILINSLCNINAKTDDGLNCLHYAVAYHRYDICELLLENKIKIHAKSNNGITAMAIAIEHRNAAICRMLIEFGYKMDKKYQWKETPLEQAIRLHSEECAITLVHNGCSTVKRKGESYFYMAVNERLIHLAQFLLEVSPGFIQESWVLKKNWPLSIYHWPELFAWLSEQCQTVFSLKRLCRAKIFRVLGRYPTKKAEKLGLPPKLMKYMTFKEYVKQSFYKRKPLDLADCPFDCPVFCKRKYCPDIDISSSSDTDDSP